MRQMNRVLWTKGTLLTPQHLQTQDRFLEDLIGFHMGSLAMCPFGFRELELDVEGLAGGSIGLTRAVGVFPDGLAFDVPASDAAPPPVTFGQDWDPDRPSLDIVLAVPELRLGGQNVSSDRGEGSTRFRAVTALCRDENTGLAEKPIQVATKNLRLLAPGQAVEGHVSLPVARVTRTPSGGFEVDPRFVPPLLDLSVSDFLMAIARRLLGILTARSAALAAMRRHRNAAVADFGPGDIANFWLLYTVNTHLPVIRHIFETRQGHPSDLFLAMLELAGGLTTFSPTVGPQTLPEYDHLDLAGCFGALDEVVRELLETVVPVRHVSVPLVATGAPSVYAASIDQDRYLSAPQLYLAVASDLKPNDLLRKAPGLKVSSGDRVDRLVKHALSGVRLTHAPQPAGVPVRLDHHYFLLERAGEDWDAIRLSRKVAVHVPAEIPNPRLELVVLLPAPAG